MTPWPSSRAALSAHLIALLSTAVLGLQSAKAQSFDCRYARYRDEKTICHEPALGRLDEELASIYRRVMLTLARSERGELDKNEDGFVRARHRCGIDRTCIQSSYRKRIDELRAALSEDKAGWMRQNADLKPSDRQNDTSKIKTQDRREGWVNPPRSP
jgi:uncharacterized protein